jgi:hypothetical protein
MNLPLGLQGRSTVFRERGTIALRGDKKREKGIAPKKGEKDKEDSRADDRDKVHPFSPWSFLFSFWAIIPEEGRTL